MRHPSLVFQLTRRAALQRVVVEELVGAIGGLLGVAGVQQPAGSGHKRPPHIDPLAVGVVDAGLLAVPQAGHSVLDRARARLRVVLALKVGRHLVGGTLWANTVNIHVEV